MRITLLRESIVRDRVHVAGDVVEVEEGRGQYLILHGAAVVFTDPQTKPPADPQTKPPADPPVRRAEVRPRGKRATREPLP